MVISRAEVLDSAAAWSILTVTVATLPIMLCTSRFRQLSWIIAIIHDKCRRFHLMNQHPPIQ
jgi:hypothetical protein